MKNAILKIFHILILVLICGIIVGSLFLSKKYPGTTFDELIFYLKSGVGNADMGVFVHSLKICIPLILVLILVLYIIFYDITFGRKKIRIRKFQIYPFKFINKHKIIFTLLLFVIACAIAVSNLGVYEYAKNTFIKSEFIEEHYVDPHTTDITFDQKRNLIFIVVESLETSFFTKEQDGNWNYEVTPELYNLLNDEDSISFYNKNLYQGVKPVSGTTWTTASVVANSTGLPFKIPVDGNEYHSENFMNGTYALGDLLKDNGYYNEVISSSRTSFGGIKEYFTKHGQYEIVDIDSFPKYNLEVTDKDTGGWGFNDRYLFEAAKQRLGVISQQDKPFNLELITIDTHFPEGYIGDYSITKYNTNYENVYATESKLIGEFIDWLKMQEYYENTTVVIVGDHLNMLQEYFDQRGIFNDNRYVYNCIINAPMKIDNNKNRIVTALDFYPTTVAAIGGKIDGDKLALGVNLFSDKKTLAEEIGFDKLDEELQKKSEFYDDNILNDEYINKIKKVQSEQEKEEEKRLLEEYLLKQTKD